MKAPVLDVTSTAAGRAIRPQTRMILGLRGNNRLLHPCQKLLRLRQRQPSFAISPRSLSRLISSTSTLRFQLSVPISTN